MNTEITDKVNSPGGNWVCYDAECALCVRWADRFRAFLKKHGFALVPLQSPEVRTVLNLPEEDLLREMRVITETGLVFGGADALAYISRVACKPVYWLTRIPGAMPLLRSAYHVVAHNRNCVHGACRMMPRKNLRSRRHHGPTTFFDMP